MAPARWSSLACVVGLRRPCRASGSPSSAPRIRSCRRSSSARAPFLVANIVTLFLYGALAGVMFLLPFDLIARRGMAASAVGATLMPFGLIIGLLSRCVGRACRPIWCAEFSRRRIAGRGAWSGVARAQPREFLDRRFRPADRHGARHGRGGDAADDGGDELRARRAGRRRVRHQQRGEPHRRACRRRSARLDRELYCFAGQARRPMRGSASCRRRAMRRARRWSRPSSPPIRARWRSRRSGARSRRRPRSSGLRRRIAWRHRRVRGGATVAV